MPSTESAAKAMARYAENNNQVWVPRSLVSTVCILKDIYKVSKITSNPGLLDQVNQALTNILGRSNERV